MPSFMHRLRWKVAASATVAAVAAVLAVLTISELGLALGHRRALAEDAMLDRVGSHAQRLADTWTTVGRLDSATADAWVAALASSTATRLVVGPGAAVPLDIAVVGPDRRPVAGSRLDADLVDRVVSTAGQGEPSVMRRADGVIVAAATISNPNGEPLGFVVVEASTADRPLGEILRGFLVAMPATVLMLLPIGLIVGILFGLITTRGLVRRLWRLGEVVAAWSRGELGVRVGDRSRDELGDLTRDLEAMAAELDRLIGTRQELAAVDERNRLARELHDTVKQHVFSIAMFLGSLDTHGPSSAAATETTADTLTQVRRLVAQVSRDLDDLILALRPAELQDQGLAKALDQLVAQWSTRADIPAELRIRGERELPLPVEEGLFRVAQEALANVARHASADTVDVLLDATEDADGQITVRLTIHDDGDGFDVDAPARGFGLDGMRERLAALGGRLVVRSERHRGTTVDARWSGETL